MIRTAHVLVLSAFVAMPALAQEANPALGATAGAVAAPGDVVGPAAVAIGQMTAAHQYTAAKYGVGGVGLRNRGDGGFAMRQLEDLVHGAQGRCLRHPGRLGDGDGCEGQRQKGRGSTESHVRDVCARVAATAPTSRTA